MRTSLASSLFLPLGLILPAISFSAFTEDLEGSGYYLDISGSGSGAWTEEAGESTNIKDPSDSENVRISTSNAGGGLENSFDGSSVPTFEKKHWPAEESRSGFGVVANSKGLLEREEIFAAVLAGGIVGVILAATLAATLIYKWQKKDNGGFILGRRKPSDEDYHRHSRDKVV